MDPARAAAAADPVDPAADSRCPRCGGAFHCGVNDRTPCACTTLALSPAHQAALARRYRGCLCLACLQALAARPADSL